jgi:hypothetical protein
MRDEWIYISQAMMRDIDKFKAIDMKKIFQTAINHSGR